MHIDKPHSYNVHETDRMLQLHGVPLASFKSRAFAFLLDFILTFVVFAVLVIGGGRLAVLLHIIIGDVNLKYDFEH